MIRRCGLIIGIVIASFVCSKDIFAQTSNLSLSPSLTRVIIKPNTSVNLNFELSNNADPGTVQLKIAPFKPKGNKGDMDLDVSEANDIIFSTLSSNTSLNTPFFLKSHFTQKIDLNVSVGNVLSEKDYYYVLTAEFLPPPSTEGENHVGIKNILHIPILITVTQNNQLDLKGRIVIFEPLHAFKINLFGKTYNIVDSFDSIPVVIQVKNESNTLIIPHGNITLKRKNTTVKQAAIQPVNILSRSERLLSTNLLEDCGDENCSDYSLYFKKFLIGEYSLTANITLDNSPTKFAAATSFVAVPIKLGLVFVIIAALAISSTIFLKNFLRQDKL